VEKHTFGHKMEFFSDSRMIDERVVLFCSLNEFPLMKGKSFGIFFQTGTQSHGLRRRSSLLIPTPSPSLYRFPSHNSPNLHLKTDPFSYTNPTHYSHPYYFTALVPFQHHILSQLLLRILICTRKTTPCHLHIHQ
jgi:hypothetical protein